MRTLSIALAFLIGLGFWFWTPPRKAVQNSLGLDVAAQLARKTQKPRPQVSLLAQQLRESLYRPLDPKAAGEAVILNYHDVFLDRSQPDTVWYDTTPEEFVQQMQWLRSRDAVFISLDQLRRHLTQNTPLPKNAVVVTFDDNHQGFYDYIYPIINREKIPVALFVHTDFVGRRRMTSAPCSSKGAIQEADGQCYQAGRQRMDWPTLQQISQNPLVTIGSHTLSHRDLTQLSQAQQRQELQESKWLLERKLGRPVAYVAYSEGKADALTFKLAREVGYAMGFTTDWRMPADSPDMLAVGRYVQTQLTRAWFDMNPEQNTRSGLVERRLYQRPVRLQVRRDLGLRWAMIRGGRPENRLSSGRDSVIDFVRRAGAVAGINGTFFANPLLKARDNTMVGPIAASSGVFIPERNPYILSRIAERPLVLWNQQRMVFVPLKLDMNRLETIKRLMPDFTNLFVGGTWMVHKGRAIALKNPPADHWEYRPRVLFGYINGEPVLGASLQPTSTARLAQAAAAAGVEEAVLLDSGYSTSLVYQERIIAVGRVWEGVPSRPVPHAIVIYGKTDALVGR
jgi:poly-beta-1,6-N-acetyl-D-glucosamine N-deacetylase